MECNTILYEKKDLIGTITLNRPKSMNAMNSEMFSDLAQALNEIGADDAVKVVIITGHEKFFGAGADIMELEGLATPQDAYRFLKNAARTHETMDNLEKPIIAAVSGFALGGGCELALACDFRIAADNAKFGLPEIKIGVFPRGGGTQRLPRLVGMGVAMELLFTGNFIDAAEALRVGLINKVFPFSFLLAEIKKIAATIAEMPGVALRATRMAVKGGIDMDLKSALKYEARCFESLFSTEDQKEGMRAFIEKRKPIFQNR